MGLAIVTGGSRGIGAAIAERLAADGHDVVINCASSVDKAEAVAEKCRAHGVNAVPMQWDVSDHAACEKALAEIKEKLGVPYILVNNAGITRDGLMVRMKEEQFDDVIRINLKGAYNMLQLCGGYDHNFCLSGEHAATAYGTESGIKLDLYTDLPGMQVYTGNFLRGNSRFGALAPRSGFALEPQFFPNAVNTKNFVVPVLKAGEQKSHYISYIFGSI